MLIHLICNSLICIGVNFATKPSEIFGFVNGIFSEVHWIHKPLHSCLMCMSSVWGLLYLYFNDSFAFSANTVFYLFALCGLNCLVNVVWNKLISEVNG